MQPKLIKVVNAEEIWLLMEDGKVYIDGEVVYTIKEGETELDLLKDMERIFGPLQVMGVGGINEEVTANKEQG